MVKSLLHSVWSASVIVVAHGVAGCTVDIPEIACVRDSDCPAATDRCIANQCTSASADVPTDVETESDVDGTVDTAPDAAAPCPAGPGIPAGAAVGDSCGTCNNGVVVCDQTAGVLSCVGARVNQCGGCGLDDQRIGTPCNHCGGLWECDPETGRTICPLPAPNPCGGCGSLQPSDAVPGRTCDLGSEGSGYWACTTPDAITCVAPERNPCGGIGELASVPGEPCGVCNTGRWVCGSDTSVSCCYGTELERCEESAGEAALNNCGTCAALPQNLAGTACGRCGQGTWSLDCGSNQLVCTGDSPNVCGGCTALAGRPGDACDSGFLQCSGADSLSCTPVGGRNACGGTSVLDALPGQPCGSCDAGTVICAGPDQTRCAGDLLASDCGSCAPESLPIDSICTEGRTWACGDSSDGTPVCNVPEGLNVCGGTVETADVLFAACGDCGGRSVCSETTIVCAVSEANRPALRYVDADGDGWGDADDPGSSQCGNAVGFAAQTGDCDDEEELVNPDQTEVTGNSLDDDCDENTRD